MPIANAATSSIDRSLSHVRAWVRARRDANTTNEALAREIGVDEKTVRQAQAASWNPRAETLRQFERVIPVGWQIGDAVPSEAPTASAAEGASAAESEARSA